jgi:hypothetical protein
VLADQEARQNGYSVGGEDFPVCPYAVNDGRAVTWHEGVQALRMDNESGQRIENLISQHRLMREERDARVAERDALAESIEQLREEDNTVTETIAAIATAGANVPTVDPIHDTNAVCIYRSDSNFNVQPWGAMGQDWTSEQLAASLRGALADAFHAGAASVEPQPPQPQPAAASAADHAAEVETLRERLERVTHERDGLNQNIANQYNQLQEWQRRWDGVMTEWTHISESLLQQAEDRSWCAEYEEWCEKVNSRTRVLKVIARHKTYLVRYSVEAVPSNVERDLGMYGSVDCDQNAMYTVSISIECKPDDLDQEIENHAENLSGVSQVLERNVGDAEQR